LTAWENIVSLFIFLITTIYRAKKYGIILHPFDGQQFKVDFDCNLKALEGAVPRSTPSSDLK